MAEILDRFPTAGGAAIYPWEEWLDGQIRKLRAGVDFKSKPTTFRSNAQLQASKRGGRARIRHLASENPEAIVLQFIPSS
jgi:hypothetical protein